MRAQSQPSHGPSAIEEKATTRLAFIIVLSVLVLTLLIALVVIVVAEPRKKKQNKAEPRK